MPTGTPHAASTQRSLSGHLTVGVHIVAWREIVRAALDRIASDPSLDDPIPRVARRPRRVRTRPPRAAPGAGASLDALEAARDRRRAVRTLPVDPAAADPWRARRPGGARRDRGRVAARPPGRFDLRAPDPRRPPRRAARRSPARDAGLLEPAMRGSRRHRRWWSEISRTSSPTPEPERCSRAGCARGTAPTSTLSGVLTRSERCSQASEARGEPMAGTASTVRSWLLLEDPGPWGRDALRDARLPERVGLELQRRCRAAGVRPLLIRRASSNASAAARLWRPRVLRDPFGTRAPVDRAHPAREGSRTPRPRSARARSRRPAWFGPVDGPLSWCARTAAATSAVPSAAVRSRRPSPPPSPARRGRAATSAATGSRAISSRSRTACTSVACDPTRPPRWPARTRTGSPCGTCADGRASDARPGGRARAPDARGVRPRRRRRAGAHREAPRRVDLHLPDADGAVLGLRRDRGGGPSFSRATATPPSPPLPTGRSRSSAGPTPTGTRPDDGAVTNDPRRGSKRALRVPSEP
jgi:hypothetical protein